MWPPGADDLRLHEAFERRAGGRERRELVVRAVVRRVVVRERADRDDVRHVARHFDRHRIRARSCPRTRRRRCRPPRSHDRLVQRIIPVIRLRRRPSDRFSTRNVVLLLVRDDPVDALDHVDVAARALTVERAHHDQIRLRRDAEITASQVLRAARRDGRDVRAVAVADRSSPARCRRSSRRSTRGCGRCSSDSGPATGPCRARRSSRPCP